MSRRIRKAEEIIKRENYFNRLMALEVQRDQKKQKEYNDMFDSLDEMLAGGSEGVSGKTHMLLATNLNGEEFEAGLCDVAPMAWIDWIENQKLYRAVSQLSDQQKKLLTYRFYFCLSQIETAELMGIAQQTVSRHESRIFKMIKKFLV